MFADWITAVRASRAHYQRLDRSDGAQDIGVNDILVEITGRVLEPDGTSPRWTKDKSHTINGYSLRSRLSHGDVRVFFSGDLNEGGRNHLLGLPAETPA